MKIGDMDIKYLRQRAARAKLLVEKYKAQNQLWFLLLMAMRKE